MTKKEKELRCPLDCWDDEDWASIYDCLYQASMQRGAVIPALPSYLKGHQRTEEYRRERSTDTVPETISLDRDAVRQRIAALERELHTLRRISTDLDQNTPHKQLELF